MHEHVVFIGPRLHPGLPRQQIVLGQIAIWLLDRQLVEVRIVQIENMIVLGGDDLGHVALALERPQYRGGNQVVADTAQAADTGPAVHVLPPITPITTASPNCTCGSTGLPSM